jgi:hypothetical protein
MRSEYHVFLELLKSGEVIDLSQGSGLSSLRSLTAIIFASPLGELSGKYTGLDGFPLIMEKWEINSTTF